MAYEFKFPDIGEGITEGEILEWDVKEGDIVQEHQALGKIETDKAVAEIPSPVAGTVLKIHFKAGDTVKVGETLVTIGEKGEKIPEKTTQSTQPSQQAAVPASTQQATQQTKQPIFKPAGAVGYLEEAPEEESGKKKELQINRATKGEKRGREKELPAVLATPATRRLAIELGVNLAEVKGTGLGGRITESDVKEASGNSAVGVNEKGSAAQSELVVQKKYDMWGYVDRVSMRGVRKAIAKKMVESFTHTVPVTAFDEADVTKLWELREREKKRAEAEGIKLTFLPFIMKACVHALQDHPFVNSSMDDEREEIILKHYYNIGIAVDTEDGLMVPVIKGADQKSIKSIAKEMEEISEKTRQRKINLGDLKGGTFTITNYGSIRGTWATPIINYPEAAILGVGRIFDKMIVQDGKVYKRKIMPLSLTFDHRIFDGADAAKFMQTLIEHLEDPDLILVEG